MSPLKHLKAIFTVNRWQQVVFKKACQHACAFRKHEVFPNKICMQQETLQDTYHSEHMGYKNTQQGALAKSILPAKAVNRTIRTKVRSMSSQCLNERCAQKKKGKSSSYTLKVHFSLTPRIMCTKNILDTSSSYDIHTIIFFLHLPPTHYTHQGVKHILQLIFRNIKKEKQNTTKKTAYEVWLLALPELGACAMLWKITWWTSERHSVYVWLNLVVNVVIVMWVCGRTVQLDMD